VDGKSPDEGVDGDRRAIGVPTLNAGAFPCAASRYGIEKRLLIIRWRSEQIVNCSMAGSRRMPGHEKSFGWR
jgi:hypothetical protein